MKAIVYRGDLPNVNGVVYPLEELEMAVEKFNVQDGRHFVELADHYPSDPTINLDLVAGRVSLEIDGDCVVAHLKLLETPMGQLAKKIIDQMFLVPSAQGNVKGEAGIKEVTSLRFERFSLVQSSKIDLGTAAVDAGMFKLSDK